MIRLIEASGENNSHGKSNSDVIMKRLILYREKKWHGAS